MSSHRSDGLLHPLDGAGRLAFGALCWSWSCMARRAGRARRRGGRRARRLVLACSGAVTAFAVLGKVLSPQFVIWVAAARRARVRLAHARAGAGGARRARAHAGRVPCALLRRGRARAARAGARRRCATLVLLAVLGTRRCAGPTAFSGTSSCSMPVARPSPSASTSTAFSQGSSSEVSKRTLVRRQEALERLLALDADHAAARAGHADVGHVGGAARAARGRRPSARACGCPRRRSRGRRGASPSPPSRSSPRRACRRARASTRSRSSASSASASANGERTAVEEDLPGEVDHAEPPAAAARRRCGRGRGCPSGSWPGARCAPRGRGTRRPRGGGRRGCRA